uniref:RNase H type-1 domain-containing protein n=1 Tax=Cajanus cajan TaxID=3821 RepID=A0A151R9Z2_CAJCA|nr:hypothetical protein KK1_039237 [Cajanus cajan]
MGLFSIVKAEFWAIKHTLNLASSRGFEHVEVELDSQMAIHMLLNPITLVMPLLWTSF